MALSDIIERLRLMPGKQQIALAGVVAFSIALMAGIMVWSQHEDLQVLYSNLGQEDAGQVIGKLKEMKVPYRVEGNAIFVPAVRVYELRLELAGQGLPQGGGIGYEIFDKNQIGVTEFVQRLNYVRALQGELSRTIRQLSEVEQARVHIAIPEKSIFTDKEEKPTASVVVKLKAGRTLGRGQVGGIVHLVSSSVEGLMPQNITVIDSAGSLLSKPSEGDTVADAKQLEYQKSVDTEYQQKLQSMLEGIVGPGKAIVRVSTKLDFTKIERTEEKFDPDTTAVRNEQRSSEKSGGPTTGGIPGMLSNQPGSQGGAASGAGNSQKSTENVQYEVSRSVSKIVQPRGELKSISVAVLVDGTYKQEGDKKAFVPRTEADMKKYSDLVRAAVGFNKDRGDQVIVENVPFETAAHELKEEIDWQKWIFGVLRYLLPVVGVILLVLFVLKPLIEILKKPVRILSPELAAAQQAVAGAHIEVPAGEAATSEVRELVKKDPKKAATVLKDWMAE
ncbi:MAG TPA: flagellar basal-body MS-ring/collar protein FliF [Dissulfurispiraceae bacterium]|nr:flagellar basal-body MS-ring/collar protein FliF [Dissulfurispiraceae bacterium]